MKNITYLIAWIVTSGLGGLGGWGLVIGRTVTFEGPTNIVPNFIGLVNKFVAIKELGNRIQNSACKLGLSAVDSFISLIGTTAS